MKSVYLLTSMVLATTLVTADLQAQSPRNRPEREPRTTVTEREARTTATTTQTTANIQQEIQTQITSDPLLRGARIEVVEEGDTIILKGSVDSERAYERALTIAYSIEGVKTVEVKELEVVCPKHPNEDFIKAARVRGILISEGIIPAEYVHREFVEWPVHVFVTDGAVTVSGFVVSDDIRTRLSTRFRSIPEVGTVRVNVRTDATRGRVEGTLRSTDTRTGVTSTTDTTTGVTGTDQDSSSAVRRSRSGAAATDDSTTTTRSRSGAAATDDSTTTTRSRSSTERNRRDDASQRSLRDDAKNLREDARNLRENTRNEIQRRSQDTNQGSDLSR